MAASVCVFVCVFIVVLYVECSGKVLQFNDTEYLGDVFSPINAEPPPVYWDWRDKKMVTPVKNQMHCNAAWAFSAVGSIESHLKIHKKKDVSLSEQFLLDCDKNNAGCTYASVSQTFANIVADLGGVLLTQDYYSYSGIKDICRWCNGPQPVPIVGFKRVGGVEEEMARYVYEYGPLSAAINSASMAKYTKGIDQPSEEDCPPDRLDHSVVIVGYNVYLSPDGKQSIPYWIIKNSWGTKWGDKGFYYLERGRNACGIAKDVSYPIVK